MIGVTLSPGAQALRRTVVLLEPFMKRILTTFALAALMVGLKTQAYAVYANPAAVPLGTAGNFSVLAKTGIATSGGTILGDIGVSPGDQTTLTGFSQVLDFTGTYSTSTYVPGYKIYASDYTAPTPSMLTIAVGHMQNAYTVGGGATPDLTNDLGGILNGVTYGRGVYRWTSNVDITGNITLDGSASDVFILQIYGTLDLESGMKVLLSGGAVKENVFWIVADVTTLHTTSVMTGNILDQTLIASQTGSTLNGKALAQSAVTISGGSMDGTLTVPSPTPTPSATYSPTPGPSFTATATFTATPSPTPGAPAGCSDPDYLYPSPAKGAMATIVYCMKEAGDVTIRLHNQTGRLVDTVRESKVAGSQSSKVSTGRFADGTYYYVISMKYASGANETRLPRKFVVLH